MIKVNNLLLIILDGWGIDKDGDGNAITRANTPNYDYLLNNYPHTELQAAGEGVGLPKGVMGTSEVGHLNIGAGRVVEQEATIINKEITKGEFKNKKELNKLFEHVEKRQSQLHFLGLLSNCYVHSTYKHLFEALKAAKSYGIKKEQIKLHTFSDGRDSPPNSSYRYFKILNKFLNESNLDEISTISGRYYGMDRDNRWERTELAYRCISEGKGKAFSNYKEALDYSHHKGITDEFIVPCVINKTKVLEGDGLFLFNFREDRMRQITSSILEDRFAGFKRNKIKDLYFLSMVEFEKEITNFNHLYKKVRIENTLAEVLSENNIKQFHIAESEKYAHVTYFFNGGREIEFKNEERSILPSLKDIDTYDEKPEMRAFDITDELNEKIKSGEYQFLLANFANPDMVAHTGNLEASIKACEVVDKCLGNIIKVAKKHQVDVIITADHGNAEELFQGDTHDIDTQHSTNRVPFILVSDTNKNAILKGGKAALANIAPTILRLLDINKPRIMEASDLFA